MDWQLPCILESLTMLAREQGRNCGVWAVPQQTLVVLLEVRADGEGGAHKRDWSQDCGQGARLDWKWGLEQMMDGVPEREQEREQTLDRVRKQTMN